MLKKPSADALAAAFWICLLLAVAMSAIPAAQQPRGATTESKIERKESIISATLHDPTLFYTFWIAAFTVVLGVSTIGLHRATKGLLIHAQQSDRPHMIEEIKIGDLRRQTADSNGKVFFPFTFRFHNYGNKPARVIDTSIDSEMGAKLSGAPRYASLFIGERIVATDKGYSSHAEYTPGWPIRSQHKDDLLAGRIKFFIYGQVIYEEIGGHRYINRFCYEVKFGDTHVGDWLHSLNDRAYRDYT